MNERYGNVKVTKIRAAYNALREAVRAGDMDAANAALDRYEPWADYIFDGRHRGAVIAATEERRWQETSAIEAYAYRAVTKGASE